MYVVPTAKTLTDKGKLTRILFLRIVKRKSYQTLMKIDVIFFVRYCRSVSKIIVEVFYVYYFAFTIWNLFLPALYVYFVSLMSLIVRRSFIYSAVVCASFLISNASNYITQNKIFLERKRKFCSLFSDRL